MPLVLDDELDLVDELSVVSSLGEAYRYRILLSVLVSTENELYEVLAVSHANNHVLDGL